MAELDTILPAGWHDDRKKRQLLSNIRLAEGVAHLIQTCRDNARMTFDQCASYIRQNSILIDSAKAIRTSIRLVHVTDSEMQSEEKTYDQVLQSFLTMAKVDDVTKTYAA